MFDAFFVLQYIESLTSVRMRLEAYSHIAQFIHSDDIMSDSEKSFAMLQSLLYHTHLAIISEHRSELRLKVRVNMVRTADEMRNNYTRRMACLEIIQLTCKIEMRLAPLVCMAPCKIGR